MKWILLLVLIPVGSAALDPCENCSIPGPFIPGDDTHCDANLHDDSYTPTFVRYSLGTECYLQMMDCPYYETTNGVSCFPTTPPQQALQCFNGKFTLGGIEGTSGSPVERIRCNPDAAGYTFGTSVNCDGCALPGIFSETDTEFCGDAGSAGIQMTKTNNGSHCVLTLSGCDSYDVAVGYDGTGMCRSGENIVGVCVNGRFKLDGREIYKARCGPTTAPPEEECDKNDWKYNWMTDNYYKLGYNKTFDDAQAACVAEGGQLASIHSQEENDFILSMVRMDNPTASFGTGLRIYFGMRTVWVDMGDGTRRGSQEYVDNTPTDYQSWDFSAPMGFGDCVALHTSEVMAIPEYGITVPITPGAWRALDCSIGDGYICKKPAKFKCTQCPSITQNITGDDDGTLSVSYGIAGSGCRTATFTCNSTIPDNRVRIWSGDGGYYSIDTACNSLVTWLYTCNEEGVWGIHYEGGLVPQPPTAICKNIGPCETTTTTTTTPAPATACTSCPSFTQKPTAFEDSIDANLNITYEMVAGENGGACKAASFVCKTTTPGRRVNIYTDAGDLYSNYCNEVSLPGAYVCRDDGKWYDWFHRTPSSPRVECFQDTEC